MFFDYLFELFTLLSIIQNVFSLICIPLCNFCSKKYLHNQQYVNIGRCVKLYYIGMI
jgi:hypothetical protein